MKKFMLALLGLILLSVSGAFAGEIQTGGDFRYILLEDGSAKITAYTKAQLEDAAVIPEELDGHPVSVIATMAFENCSGMISVELPESLKAIEGGAFFGCDGLKEIRIPAGVEEIDSNPFYACRSLLKIMVSPDNPRYAVIDGVLFNKKEKMLVCYPAGREAEIYSVPMGILKIGDYAFGSCEGIVKVIIPESTDRIGKYAFAGCKGLEKVDLPRRLKNIGMSAFQFCNSLREIILPKGLRSICPDTFFNCKNLERVVLPEGLETIDFLAFYGCRSLRELDMPESLKIIGDCAFENCDKLESVNIPGGIEYIGEKAFYGCGNLTLTVPRDSAAMEYAKANAIDYIYTDSMDWLNA